MTKRILGLGTKFPSQAKGPPATVSHKPRGVGMRALNLELAPRRAPMGQLCGPGPPTCPSEGLACGLHRGRGRFQRLDRHTQDAQSAALVGHSLGPRGDFARRAQSRRLRAAATRIPRPSGSACSAGRHAPRAGGLGEGAAVTICLSGITTLVLSQLHTVTDPGGDGAGLELRQLLPPLRPLLLPGPQKDTAGGRLWVSPTAKKAPH